MPEHDTHDLDAAFARLERDITSLSTAPGARAAVDRARRRRRTTGWAYAAVAVIAIGGVAVAQGIEHHSEALEPTSSLPTPAPLDAPALTGATQGWTGAWDASAPAATGLINGPLSRCLEQAPVGSDAAEPARASGNQYFNAGDAASLLVMADFGAKTAQADALWTGLTDTVSQCANTTLSGHRAWDGAESTSYGLTTASGKTEHLWIARTGSTFGMLWLVQASEPVPEGNDTAVMTALVSALQWPGSYQDVGSTSSGSASSSATASVSETGFARALAGWSSGWKQQGGTDVQPTTACGTDRWSEGSDSGSGSSLGVNGDQEFATFASPAQAASAARVLAEQLRTCTDTEHDVHTVAISDGGNVVVAVGGANGTVWWIVQKGPDVGYIEIPASATPPPDSVSAAVGSMLSQILSGNQASSTEQSGDPEVSASSVAPAP